MKQHSQLIIIFFLIISISSPFTSRLDAADQETEKKEIDGAEARRSWTFFPILAYNSETGLILGASTFYFPPESNRFSKKSSIDIFLFGTTKGQFFLNLMPNLISRDDKYRFRTKIMGTYWKSKFYGIGNNTPDMYEEYETSGYRIELSLDRRFPKGFTIGPVVDFRMEKVDPQSEGLLDTGIISGAGEGTYFGLGISAGYDTRDNLNAPHSGNLARYEYVTYLTAIGSDLNFNAQMLDLRHYFPTSQRTTLAVAGHMRLSRGSIPFRLLSKPDGVKILRGIENRRYIDRDLLAFQMEFRFPVKGRFSAAVFADIAQVADNISNVKIDEFKSSVGGGIRYALNQEQQFNMRCDLAWVDSGFGLVVSVREAF